MNLCECGKVAELGSDTCFLCRVRSVGFGFVGGGGYGRENFSTRTNSEFLNEHVGDVRRPGIAPLSDFER